MDDMDDFLKLDVKTVYQLQTLQRAGEHWIFEGTANKITW